MKIGILTSGGDCPGINATIRAVGKSAITAYNMEVVGIRNGFSGILDGDYEPLNLESFSDLLPVGGTILGTSREKPLRLQLLESKELRKDFKDAYQAIGLDAIVAIGGNGTQKTAEVVSSLGLNVIGIPKTIDNDVWGTEITFGFDTAVSIATEAIDRLHSTAASHKRVMVVEVMGHNAGWIALHAGMAGGADVILLPELGFNLDVISDALLKRMHEGKKHSIVVIAEGLKIEDKKRPAHQLCKILTERTGLECRETVLGYVQRGGAPTAFDRNLCTQYGAYATRLIHKGTYGVMTCIENGAISHIPLSKVSDKLKLVPRDHELIINGERMGVCFGVKPIEK